MPQTGPERHARPQGRKDDPLYRCRRLLTKAHKRLDDAGEAKLTGLLEAGDPKGEVRMCWHAKETVRSLYDITEPSLAGAYLDEFVDNTADDDMPEEVRTLSGTLSRWRNQILAWHSAFVTNGPTESMNNLIKRIKRIGFGFRRFSHYRITVLLYAGKPKLGAARHGRSPLKSEDPVTLGMIRNDLLIRHASQLLSEPRREFGRARRIGRSVFRHRPQA